MKNSQHIICIGANHRTANTSLREMLHVPDEVLRAQLPLLKHQLNLQECMILSTCNRLEIYGVLEQTSVKKTEANALSELFSELHKLTNPTSQLTAEMIAEHTYAFRGLEAVRHAFAVASSLDSLVLGETQITGQFKDAFQLATEAKTAGPLLSRLFQEALSAAKAVRTKTAIGQGTVSISSAAVAISQLIFENPGNHRILVIGSGEMGYLAGKHFGKFNPNHFYMTSRRYEHAQHAVEKLGFGTVIHWDQIGDYLPDMEIIVSATRCPTYTLDAKLIRRAQQVNRLKARCLVDIAMPRDIDPACSDIPEIYLFDIDDLKQVVHGGLENRSESTAEASQLLARRLEQFGHWLSLQTVAPALAEFHHQLDDLFTTELMKTLNKSIYGDLSEEQQQGLHRLMESVAHRLCGRAGQSLHRVVDDQHRELLARALQSLFSQSNPSNLK